MHAMEKPHKMIMAIRLETQLSRICTWRHRVRCRTAVGGAIVTCACAWCARVRCARAIPGPSGVAGLTAATAPLPHETQRFNLAPAGERASMALTCASEHSCGSPAVPMLVVLIQTRSTERVLPIGDVEQFWFFENRLLSFSLKSQSKSDEATYNLRACPRSLGNVAKFHKECTLNRR